MNRQRLWQQMVGGIALVALGCIVLTFTFWGAGSTPRGDLTGTESVILGWSVVGFIVGPVLGIVGAIVTGSAIIDLIEEGEA